MRKKKRASCGNNSLNVFHVRKYVKLVLMLWLFVSDLNLEGIFVMQFIVLTKCYFTVFACKLLVLSRISLVCHDTGMQVIFHLFFNVSLSCFVPLCTIYKHVVFWLYFDFGRTRNIYYWPSPFFF